MAHTTFEIQTIGSSSAVQPLLSTSLTAAIQAGIVVDKIDPRSGYPVGAPQTVAVANTDLFQADDLLWLDTGASAEKLVVQADPSTSTALVIRPVKAHASGAFLALYLQCDSFNIIPLSTNTGTLYLFAWKNAFNVQPGHGRKSLAPAMSAGAPVAPSQCLMASIPPAGQGISSDVFGANPINTSEYWVGGTINDSFIVVLQGP